MELLAEPQPTLAWVCPECGHGSPEPRDQQAHLDAHRQLRQFFREWDAAAAGQQASKRKRLRALLLGVAALVAALALAVTALTRLTGGGADPSPPAASRPGPGAPAVAPPVPPPVDSAPAVPPPPATPGPSAPANGAGPSANGAPARPAAASTGAADGGIVPPRAAAAPAPPVPATAPPPPAAAPAGSPLVLDTCLLGIVCISLRL